MNNSDAKKLWDAAYDRFFATAESEIGWTQFVLPYLHRKKEYFKGKAVLDIGCGNGRVAAVVAPVAKSVSLIDWSPEIVRRLQGSYPDWNIAVDDAEMLTTVPDAAINAALCFNVLPNHENMEKAIAAMYRCLVPQGRAFIVIEHPMRSCRVHRATNINDIPKCLQDCERAHGVRFTYLSTFLGKEYPIMGWHRPVSAYIQACINAGFRIEAFEELFLDIQTCGNAVIAEAKQKSMLCEPPFVAMILQKP